MYDRGAWFLMVTVSSSRALCCSPSVKKQKHDFHACMVDRADIEKVVEDKDSQTQKGRRRWQSSCLLIKWKRKNWENLRKKKVCPNFENILSRSEKERIRSMYNKTIITFGFRDIQNNQGKGYVISLSLRLRLITLDLNYSGYHKNLIQ